MRSTAIIPPVDYVTVVFADLENCSFWGGTIAGTSRMIMYCKGEKLRSSQDKRITNIQKRYLTTTPDGHTCCEVTRIINNTPPENPNLFKRMKRIVNRYLHKAKDEDERDTSL